MSRREAITNFWENEIRSYIRNYGSNMKEIKGIA